MTSLVEVEWHELLWNDVDSGALELFLVMRENMFLIKLIIFFIFSFLRSIFDISVMEKSNKCEW